MSSEKFPDRDPVEDILMNNDLLFPVHAKQTLSDYIVLAATLPEENKELNLRLQANLLQVAQKFTLPELKVFVTDTQNILIDELSIFENEEEEVEDPLAFKISFSSQLDEYLKNTLGEDWISQSDKEQYRSIEYKHYDEVKAVDVAHEDNFYFKPPVEKFCVEDKFPPIGAMGCHTYNRDEFIGKNLSVFDPNGIKVFWGDLRYSEIEALIGTYYVLRESTSYRDVPEFAIVIETDEPSYDPFRPEDALPHELNPNEKPMLEVAYVKSYCTGAIVDGSFVKHEQTKDI